MSTPSMRIAPGELLDGRYDVLSAHPGGMGIVYILSDRETGERYAAKTVREEMRDNPRVKSRFEREIRTWIGLGRHPNLVSALFFREVAGAPFLFLEYVDGPTLAAVLKADGPLNLAQALDFALQYAAGLSFAHEKPLSAGAAGLVHRDVKPENLFVTRDRTAKVSDLGIAKVLAADLEATAEGIGMGTPYYVAPEQLKGMRDVDGRADVYSFGAVLYEMLTGRIPLRAETLESQIYLILRSTPERPSTLNPKIPPALDELLMRCLAKLPADRPGSFRALARELRGIVVREAPDRLDPPASSCGRCGYASAHVPAACPLCEGAMTAPGAWRPVVGAAVRTPESRPADLVILSVEAKPRPVGMGDPVEITITLANHGTADARRVEVPYPVPDRDRFRLVESDDVWRGEIAPTGAGAPTTIRYHLIPLREGEFALPPATVRWFAGEEARSFTATEAPRILVTFNYHLPMAGRDASFAGVLDFLSRRAAGFVLVEGEVGGGRTRFLDEVSERLKADRFLVLRGKALERSREPMKVFHDVAREIFGLGAGSFSASTLMARVIDRLAPLLGEDPVLAGHFAAFLRGADVAESQAGIRPYLWFRLLSALARERPVVLVLDDLQWADEESIDLAETLVRRAGEERVPIAVVAATLAADPEERTRRRIGWLKDRFAALATNPGLTMRVHLTPLGPVEAKHLLEMVFPGNTIAEDHPWLLPALVAQSGGNPFHLVQILRMLREARDERGEPLVSAEGGAWTLKPEMTEARLSEWIPEAVEGMVRALVMPLPEPVREVLEIAAAIGEEFETALITAVRGGDDLDECLDQLERADFVRPVDERGEKLKFTSSLMPSIVERLVKERSRRSHARLHRELARALEATFTPRELKRAAMRYARHLLLAGERERAFPWLVSAAEGYVRQQLFLRADAALLRALELVEQGVPATEQDLGTCWYLRGEVSRVLGNLSEALAAFNKAVEHLSTGVGRMTLARAMSKMGKIHEVRGEIDRALYCYQVGAQIREDEGDRSEMAHSLNNLGSLHLLRGEDDKAREAFERGRAMAEESGNRQALQSILDNYGELHSRQGRWEDAEAMFRQGLAIAEEIGDRLGAARALNGLGGLSLRRGDVDGAREFYRKTMEIRGEVGDREGVANVLSNLGVIHDRRGEYEEALRYYRRAAEAHRAIGSRRGLATVLNNIGVVNLTRGDVTMAIERFEEALAIRREMGDRPRLGLALQNLGEALALAGRTEEAQAALDEALSVANSIGDAAGSGSVRASRAAVHRQAGRIDLAAAEVEAGLSAEGRDPRTRAALHLEMAELLTGRGDEPGAAAAARRALELARDGGDRFQQAQALRLVAAARARQGDGTGALADLEGAEAALDGTSGPELLRVRLEMARILAGISPERARETLHRARGLVDALSGRGAVLPERADLDRLLAAGGGGAPSR